MAETATPVPGWIRRWLWKRPSQVLDCVSDVDVLPDDIAEVACHHERAARDGEELDQVAIVRLVDGRWAALVFSMFSKTRPFSVSLAVAASFERIWWFGIGDKERERLSPQVARLAFEKRASDPMLDADEQQLLAVLRANPDDAATRAVYADLLEQRGDLARAQLARVADALPHQHHAGTPPIDLPMPRTQVAWRALVVDAPIVRCYSTAQRQPGARSAPIACTLRWRTATPTDDDLTRRCPARGLDEATQMQLGCGRLVRFCTTIEAAALAGPARESIVLDPALDAVAALSAYDTRDVAAASPDSLAPSASMEASEKPSIWARVRRWFQ